MHKKKKFFFCLGKKYFLFNFEVFEENLKKHPFLIYKKKNQKRMKKIINIFFFLSLLFLHQVHSRNLLLKAYLKPMMFLQQNKETTKEKKTTVSPQLSLKKP